MRASPHFFFVLLFHFFMVSFVLATPPSALFPHRHPHHSLETRAFILSNNTLTGNLTAVDPTTRQAIPQGPATDGSGNGFDVPAIIWMVFSLVVGFPLALFGIRGWRLTTGFGIGLAAAVACKSQFPQHTHSFNSTFVKHGHPSSTQQASPAYLTSFSFSSSSDSSSQEPSLVASRSVELPEWFVLA